MDGIDYLIRLVSIHASSREDATVRRMRIIGQVMFQSTRPRGRTRRGRAAAFRLESKFQSTRPRGRTRLCKVFVW